MTEYVCGFRFENDKVALIHKLRPDWQKHLLNGIGGKIESGESPETAMVREFLEETGVQTFVMDWWPFAVLSGSDWKVHFFSSHGDLSKLKTTTDEEIVVLPISEVTTENAVPNLAWLIPMGRGILKEQAYQFLITEVQG